MFVEWFKILDLVHLKLTSYLLFIIPVNIVISVLTLIIYSIDKHAKRCCAGNNPSGTLSWFYKVNIMFLYLCHTRDIRCEIYILSEDLGYKQDLRMSDMGCRECLMALSTPFVRFACNKV